MDKLSLKSNFLRLAAKVTALPRSTKGMIMLLADVVALPSCAAIAAWIVTPVGPAWSTWMVLLPLVVAIPALKVVGFYRSIVRFMGLELIVDAFKSATVTAVVLVAAIGLTDSWAIAYRGGSAFWLLAIVYIAGSRMLVRLALLSRHRAEDRVLIYGAGNAGVHLAAAIASRGDFALIGFVDDNPALQGAVINGLEVHAPRSLSFLIDEFGISRVFLALPSIRRRRRQRIINQLEKLPVHVQTMPDINDLISGKARVDDIREVDIADLLGRDIVPPVPELLDACIKGKSVMVTGAGGSIGSELCVQIVRLAPKVLILLDVSEVSLYRIDQFLCEIVARESLDTQIVPLIGSVHHHNRVREVLRAYSVGTIYHAAAYKHVPLVEHNMIEGIRNNVYGTLHTAQAAIDAGVESFVLVSTDKAVKPTNVMGATKRFAELVLQGLSLQQSRTVFSIVRFGNVLESSGSVVPLFREQIRKGGPVTVTHPDIYRYFMTIPEAASLVLQAGSMAKGGDVFVLDMGQPVRIADLAEKMIHLMGLTVRDDGNPDGDIEVQYTGLRPAEKLFEELLIGDNVMGTEHRRILRAEEEALPWEQLRPLLDQLWDACQQLDCDKARQLLLHSAVGYAPTELVRDLVWLERYATRKAVVGDNVTTFERRRNVTPNRDRPH
jgi:FlaA1/EpsC-like NDP-sugar epimerase